jgi:uncharacterized protein YjbJ (UPF0337 family)
MSATDKARHKVEKFTGQAKERIGKVTGNRRLQNEGKVDQVKANLKTTGEKVKDAARGKRR